MLQKLPTTKINTWTSKKIAVTKVVHPVLTATAHAPALLVLPLKLSKLKYFARNIPIYLSI